jgi:hypothetical protein
MRKVVYGLILAFGLSLFPATGAHADTVSDESSFVSKINDLRAGLGLPALQVNANLVTKARGWAAGMAAAGKIWHSTLSDGITADWEKLGENVGMGGSVDGLHAAFVASPHHYENLVDPDFGYVGIGIAMNGDTMYVAEEFRQLMPPKAATVAPPVTKLVSTPATTAPRPAAPKPAAPKPAAVPAAPPVTPAAASAPPAPPAPAAAPAAPPRAPSDLLISVLERLHTFDS